MKYFFEVPVYRLDPDKYYSDRERFIEKAVDTLFPGPHRRHFDDNRDRKVALTDHLQKQYGGPWNFNEIIGFIRLHFLGSQIRGEYFAVDVSRIVRTRKKTFIWRTHKLAPEITVPPHASNAEVWALIKEYLRDCSREVRGRPIDMECLDLLGPHVDWHAVQYG